MNTILKNFHILYRHISTAKYKIIFSLYDEQRHKADNRGQAKSRNLCFVSPLTCFNHTFRNNSSYLQDVASRRDVNRPASSNLELCGFDSVCVHTVLSNKTISNKDSQQSTRISRLVVFIYGI